MVLDLGRALVLLLRVWPVSRCVALLCSGCVRESTQVSGAKPVYILAIDPGTTHSGVVVVTGGLINFAEVVENREVLTMLPRCHRHVAIEMVASYGMPVGAEVFETCLWIGRFVERCDEPDTVKLIYRRDVKLHLCGNARAKDANIRQALIDRWGGKAAAVGTSKRPGPLYGVKTHAWAALAVAVTLADSMKVREAA